MIYNVLTAVNDVLVIFFDLLIYTKLTALKNDTKKSRVIMYGSCAVILVLYFAATYVFEFPAVISSFLCMSLPSFAIFWVLSKYKDPRFFTTFCFVDTVSLIIAFFSRLPGIYRGVFGAAAGCIIVLVLFSVLYFTANPYFPRYRELLESVHDGWTAMMISTLMIYLLLVFAATYPKPMIERPEYLVMYFVISLTVLSFYAVIILSLLQKKRMYDLNRELTEAVRWHNIAYVDVLTGLQNRMSYIERINGISRRGIDSESVLAVIFDIDDFKNINDTLGHHAGDEMLKRSAKRLTDVFCGERYELFRIGGDEFALIATGVSTEELEALLNRLVNDGSDSACDFSFGYARVIPAENNAMENAFIHADFNMYSQKKNKKSVAEG